MLKHFIYVYKYVFLYMHISSFTVLLYDFYAMKSQSSDYVFKKSLCFERVNTNHFARIICQWFWNSLFGACLVQYMDKIVIWLFTERNSNG